MLSGVVLAGGAGSRMGGEKGLVELCGRPMVLSVLDALSQVADDITVAVGPGRGPEYRRVLGHGVAVVEDRAAGRGPLEGLRNAFREARHGSVAVAPCDVPFLRPDIVALLARRAAGRDGAVPVVRGYLEPLVAVYMRGAGLAAFAEELASGRGKVADALARMDLLRVGEDELRAVDGQLLSFWNVNSKEDLRRAEEALRGAGRR
ncbi:MAG: molybdenum cofactor guanylyltransferase [Candidatus Thermoplasmatota archaeon]